MPDSPADSQMELETLERKHAANPAGRFFVPLANAYRKAGAVEHAESLLREGLQRHPDYLSAHIVLGRCLADRGATREAVDEFQYVLTLDPQNLIALRTLGEIARDEGRMEEAARWYGDLLAVDPMNDEARRELEILRGEGGDEQEQEPEAEFQSGGAWWERPEREEGEEEEVTVAAGVEEIVAEEPKDAEEMTDEEPEEPEVVTETIAELYARQGFTDRAAEVYRELIRRRGGDPALERRLAELEHPAMEVAPDVAEPAPESEPIAEPAPATAETFAAVEEESADEPIGDELVLSDPFADSFAQGFGTVEPEPVHEVAPEPEPEPEQPLEPAAPPAPGIRAYLGELLAWTPGEAAAEPAATIEEAAPEPEPEPEAQPEPEPESFGTDAMIALEEPGAAEAAEGIITPAEEVRFPWELPTPEQPSEPAAEAVPESEAGGGEEALFSFDAFLGEPAPAEEKAEPAEEQKPAEEEEDDLESFQAWLRSLKR